MRSQLPAIIIVVALAAAAIGYVMRRGRDDRALSYQAKHFLLTRQEHAFFDVLSHVVVGAYHVFPKVRMGDVIGLPKRVPNRMKWWGHIAQKHIDFVLCDLETLRPVLGIEVGKFSEDEDYGKRDIFVERVFSAAGLPLLRVPSSVAYDPLEVRARLNMALGTRKASA